MKDEEQERTAKRLSNQAYYQANRENIIERIRLYKAMNRSTILAAHHLYYVRHKRQYRAYEAMHNRTHPEQKRARDQRKKAREYGVPHTLTADQWLAIQRAYKGRCAYCGRRTKLTMDHVIPLIKGGGTTADNIVPACLPCNSTKGQGIPNSSLILLML